jgi:sialate O-acetylesterase
MKVGLSGVRKLFGSFLALSAIAAVGAFGQPPQGGRGQGGFPQGNPLATPALGGRAPEQAGPPPFVSAIFGDGMVLQRDKVNTIWGWSTPGDVVKVDIADKSATGTAGADGKWTVKIQPPPVGGPYTVKIAGKQTVELKDVLVGDVWICAGQSNMGFGLRQARNGAEEVKNANYPQMRFYSVAERPAYSPQIAVRGTWRAVSPATAGGLSATAYFFGRRVHQDAKVPIGLIQAAVGGAPGETFISAGGFGNFKEMQSGVDEVERRAKQPGRQYGNFINHWLDEYDIGTKNGANWADPALDDSSWKPVAIPGDFKELGVAGGVPALMWFRKEIDLPDPLPQGRASIALGIVSKMDTVYVNGQPVGNSSWVENARNYGARGLKPGRNVIAIRLYKFRPVSGFLSGAAALKLIVGGQTIPLAGEWKGKLAIDGHDPKAVWPLGPETVTSMPTVLYNGMIAPLVPLAITGAVYYQGESNTERAAQYRSLLPALITDWRKEFGQGDFPFYIISLPAFQHRKDQPGDDSWAELREAQNLTAKKLPHTCVAITIDTGDPDNIHPIDKLQGGDRLGYCALADHYGQKVPYSGPTVAKVEKTKSAIKLHFDHTDGGLVVKGDKLGEFSIAGADRKWYWADAKIEGNTIVVSSSSVPNPVAVRYAWQSNPLATLFNGAGLPAPPFRTDDWPLSTAKHEVYGNDPMDQGMHPY